jgi:SpoVK/Ycf46/Vps4 family AAA+-type ATPase
VAREPGDDVLRLHLAQVLVQAGLGQEAVAHLGLLLAGDPANAEYQQTMISAVAGHAPGPAAPAMNPESTEGLGAAGELPESDSGFDWGAAESDLTDGMTHDPVATSLRLSDVGGLEQVKARIEAGFLMPLRNPELRARYGKSLRGGLLLYGPPGCGKTYLARAVAGELGAKFITVSLADVLSKWLGESESNIAGVFEYARAQAPCLVFFDEVDAIGHKRSGLGTSGAALRGAINQLLAELDGVGSANEGVFVLGATNAPWDVDPALRRPGRFDRTVFVEPPDAAARAQILTNHLRDLPVAAELDFRELARRTEGFSGADLAHVCQSAAELAMMAAMQSGSDTRLIEASDLYKAIADVHPSTGRWFETARNVVLFADQAGEYKELAAFMKSRRLL